MADAITVSRSALERLAARYALLTKAETSADPEWQARFHDEAHDLGNSVLDVLTEAGVPVPPEVTDAVVATAFL